MTERLTEQEALQRRLQWLEERRSGIGGSDAAAILGLSPWTTAIDVWMDKKGLRRPERDMERLWWGAKLEPIVRERYERDTRTTVITPPGIVRHPQHSHMIATPDGLVVGRNIGLECKTAHGRVAHEWGEPGSDDIPAQYVVQCCHYMAVTGLPRWDVAVLIGGGDFRIYNLHADAQLEAAIIEQLREWWQRHIVQGEEPGIDGSQSARDMLHAKFPRELLPLLPAPEEAEEHANNLALVRRAVKNDEIGQAEIENHLKALIGDATGFEGRGWRATWKKARDSRTTDWEAVARRMLTEYQLAVERARGGCAPSAVWNEAVEAHTTDSPGVRRFLFKLITEGK